MSKDSFNINPDDKFWPKHHMWTYCTFLGKFTDSKGENFDLGILLENDSKNWCAAIVDGPNPEDYISGDDRMYMDYITIGIDWETNISGYFKLQDRFNERRQCVAEMVRRAGILNLIYVEGINLKK